MAAIINLCDCSSNGLPLYRPCVPAPGASCVWNYGGCGGSLVDNSFIPPILQLMLLDIAVIQFYYNLGVPSSQPRDGFMYSLY